MKEQTKSKEGRGIISIIIDLNEIFQELTFDCGLKSSS